MSAVAVATTMRIHIGLHTANLDRAVRFYRVLFGIEPVRHYADYARFEVAEPPLVLALYPSPQEAGGALNHVGLRLPDSAALVAVQQRLEEAGIATQRQDGVECCYARQTKFWVTDPDRVLWEVYTLHEDIEHSGFDDPPVTAAPVPRHVWEHRLTDPWPGQSSCTQSSCTQVHSGEVHSGEVPHADGALDEVRLEGSFNAPFAADRMERLLAEVVRVLRPGGRIAVHGLVGDRPFPGEPKLPGMASLVRHIPVETEPLETLRRAGFGGLFYEKLGDIHCFSVNGVELREMRLLGWKAAGGEWPSVLVVYKGPFDRVCDDDGTEYPRGETVAVAWRQAERLRLGPAADQFTFLES
jgi:catechol 2,3-dioxygenase-like lactoylglutathione lyase family enzyme